MRRFHRLISGCVRLQPQLQCLQGRPSRASKLLRRGSRHPGRRAKRARRRRPAICCSRSAICRSSTEPPVAIAIERLDDRLDLHLLVLEHLQVRLELRWAAGRRYRLRYSSSFFSLLDQPAPRVLELRLEKLVRALGQHLAVPQVLFDEERGQPLGDPHHRPRLVADVADTERVAPDDLRLDVLCASRSTMSSMIPVLRSSAYRLNSWMIRFEPRAAEDLLHDATAAGPRSASSPSIARSSRARAAARPGWRLGPVPIRQKTRPDRRGSRTTSANGSSRNQIRLRAIRRTSSGV